VSTRCPDAWSPELARPTIREVIEGAYRVVYRVTPDAVQILAVVHGARRFPPAEGGPPD
jgi:plasmid stabilization system protein ParE